MDTPPTKRAKLLNYLAIDARDWSKWYKNLDQLQKGLVSGCLCHVEEIELQRPVLSSLLSLDVEPLSPDFPKEYTLQFISTLKLLCDVALAQHSNGFICSKVSEMGVAVSGDEGIWEMLLNLLESSEKFISYISSKCLASLLMWARSSRLDQVFEELCSSIVTNSSSPLKLTHTVDVFRIIIDYKEEEEHPLGLTSESGGDSGLSCSKLEIDFDTEEGVEVKEVCIKTLESWWTRLITKFKSLMFNYEASFETPILTFLSLWQSIVSVKSNLDVVDTKHFYLQVESFVSNLNSALPPVLWKKLLDVFNEILCYGSTLSLQDTLPEEPCDLAHLILRCVKNRQFLQGVPYSRVFSSFGGTSFTKPVDSGWESVQKGESPGREVKNASLTAAKPVPSEKTGTCEYMCRDQSPSMVCPEPLPSSSKSPPKNVMAAVHQQCHKSSLGPSITTQEEPSALQPAPVRNVVTSTIYIGPTPDAVSLESSDDSGDKPLLQKVVLLILKCIALTVKETKDESDSSGDEENDEGESRSVSDSDTNDMTIIQRSIREVLQQLDSFIKSLVPFHPATPIGEWMVKLFSDQDDVLVEGMLCALDGFTSFIGRIEIPSEFYQALNPVITFIAFANTVSDDKDILLDLLMSNETCFLLYLLRFLKYIWKNWANFISTCGRDLEKVMGLLIRLKIALDRLVEKSLFPYNINPLLRLLEKCEEKFENSGHNRVS